MRESADFQSLPEQDPQPYGEVALGVECAWPLRLPAPDTLEGDDE